MGLSDIFRSNLKSLMEERDLRIWEVAKWSDISDSNLQRQLSGVSPFTLTAIEKVCKGLNVEPVAMLEE